MNSPFRLDATSWSPVGAMIADDSTGGVKPRRGPSLIFAVAVIGGVALATAGIVGVFFVQPSEGAPEQQPVIAAEAPIETASLDPTFLPVHKVAVQRIKLKQPPEPQAPTEAAVDQAPAQAPIQAPTEAAIDVDALAPLDPRWARATMPPPELAASVAATIPADASGAPVTALVDPTDGTETAAIDPDEAAPAQAAKPAKAQEAKADATDDPMSLVAKARPTQLTTAANMRSRPKSGSGIIMVVPQSATVQLVGCKVWCEIVYKGRRGYVYKDFLGGGRSASGGGKAKAKVSRADKPKAVKTDDTVDTADTSEQGLPGVETQTIKPLSSRLQ